MPEELGPRQSRPRLERVRVARLLGRRAGQGRPALRQLVDLGLVPSDDGALGLEGIQLGRSELGQALHDIVHLVALGGSLIDHDLGPDPAILLAIQDLGDEAITLYPGGRTARDDPAAVGDRQHVGNRDPHHAQSVVRFVGVKDHLARAPVPRRGEEPRSHSHELAAGRAVARLSQRGGEVTIMDAHWKASLILSKSPL